MVIGNGLIASQFYNYKRNDDVLIFASGVSNSRNELAPEFEREIDLLRSSYEKNREKKFVYFSTCSIGDASLANSPYVRHKLKIEKWIAENVQSYIVFRLSNPIGKNNNPNTVFNFFVNSIVSGDHFQIWKNATRNIMDVNHMYLLCNHIIAHHLFLNSIIAVANPESYAVLKIVNSIEAYFNKKGNYEILEKGSPVPVDVTLIKPLLKELNINFGENYIEEILKKYFPKG